MPPTNERDEFEIPPPYNCVEHHSQTPYKQEALARSSTDSLAKYSDLSDSPPKYSFNSTSIKNLDLN